jgi:hypothetical protein
MYNLLITMSMEQEEEHCDEPDWRTKKIIKSGVNYT